MSEWVNARIERSAYLKLMRFRNEFQVSKDAKERNCALPKVPRQATISDAVAELIRRVEEHRKRASKTGKKPRKKILYFHESENLKTTGKVAGVPPDAKG